MADLLENSSLPFQIEQADVRGRAVRLGSVANEIISAHDYPLPVARLLGDALALVSLLATALKFEGIFTLQAQKQAKADVPLSLLCADFRSGFGIRGYANLDRAAYDALVETLDGEPTLADLMGTGFMAFTIDRGGDAQRYQGIVELLPEGLAASAENYFANSEQVPTHIKLATAELFESERHSWRAGGLLVQKMPDSPNADTQNPDEDLWNRIGILTQTVKGDELVDPAITSADLLYRLFHEDGVRVFEAMPLARDCRCNEAKIVGTLEQFGRDELADMVEDGVIKVTCAFCNKTFNIAPDQLAR